MKLWQLSKQIRDLMDKYPNLDVYINIDSVPELKEISLIHQAKTTEGDPIIEIYIDDSEE